MTDDMGTPLPPPVEAPPKKSNTGLIIAIVVLVILCCCCIAILGFGWNFGDQVMQWLGFY